MPLQLTPDQERRIQAVVDAGTYSSAEEALNAAVAAVEAASTPDFEGSNEELVFLLEQGLASPACSEDQFWDSVNREINAMLAAHESEPGA